MWIVVGLGNPGREYAGTRHNAGFLFIKRLARRWDVEVKKKKYSARVAEFRRDGQRLVLALPQTYMNLSGVAVRELLAGYQAPPESAVVIYDDLDIALGEIRVRRAGSPGSHKGLGSVVAEIGTTAFPRIRLGIGPLAERADAVRFVLSPFSRDDRARLDDALARAEEALEIIVDGRIDQAMNRFNRKDTA
ncbi:MAG: aminoacyl-tRNA hydrolase [Candidatus Aminicenantes bacterium RBG_16_63_16]|nr:MAG: aminoacyl-tRNA hydrolase [Candidatus Aminicenantes bacterium RBG_16_63_16]